MAGSLQVKDSAKGILFYPYKVTEQFTAACSLSEVKLFLSPFLSPNGTVVDAYVAEKLFNFSLINEGDVSKIISSRRAKNVDLSEYSTAVYVTNQLLSKLSNDIVLEQKYKSSFRGNCLVQTGVIGIGISSTWHGTPDGRIRGSREDETNIIFDDGVDTMDTEPLCPGGEPRKTTCAQEENPEEGFSPPGSQESRSLSDGDSSSFEFKKKLNTEADFNKVVCQAVATSVVSSFTQKHRHPDFENAAYPTLLMSSKKCAIVIYDCTNDVLLITNVMELASDGSLNPEVLLLLWLVINYRSFLKYPSSIGNLASNIYAGIESSGRLSQYKSLNANNLCINTPKTKYVQMANDFPAKLLD